MESIFGFDVITISLLVAILGTIFHQIRAYEGKPLSKILDGSLATIGGSFVAAHTALTSVTIVEPLHQVLLIFSLIGITIPTAVAGQKVFSKVKSKVKNEKVEHSPIVLPGNIIQRKLLPPVLGPKDAWYQTNFIKKDNENTLPLGTAYLWIQVKNVRSYLTAILKDNHGRMLQIDQSHDLDEDHNVETTRLELITSDGKPFPSGTYYLQIQGDLGTGDAQGIKETFSIQ